MEVWRHDDGTLAAVASSRAGEHWMRLPRVGSFRFRLGRDQIEVFPENGAHPERIRDAYRRVVHPMALHAFGQEVLHASAVRGPRGVVALCAHSQTGKSTLAYGLSRRPGYVLWADDAVLFHADRAGAFALPLTFRPRLRPASAEYFGALPQRQLMTPLEPSPLAALFVLERTESPEAPEVEIEATPAGESLLAVIPHAYCLALAEPERKRQMVESYLELVRSVPVGRIRVRTGFEHLPNVLDAIEQAVART